MQTNKPVLLYTFGRVDADRPDLHNHDQLIILLTYLALNGESSRSSIAELFWPEAGNPLNSLSSALTRLRKAAPGCLTATTKTVSANVELDAVSMTSAAREADYPVVSKLYSGEFLYGFKFKLLGMSLEDWIYAQRDVLASVALRSAIAWFESDPNERTQAAELAERAVSTASVSNLADSELAVLYEMFETSRRPRAQNLLTEIVELGLDSCRIVRRRRPSSVPPVGELIGRKFDLAVLEQACQPGQVVHLWGAAGVGKTALIEAAAKLPAITERFSGRLFPLTLNGQQSGTVLVERIAAALQLPLDVSQPLGLSVERYVRDPLLVLIDDVPSSRTVCDVLKSLSGGPLGVVTAGLRPMENEPVIDFGLKGLATEARDRFEWTDAATLLYRCLDEFGLIFEDRHSPSDIVDLARQVSGVPLAIGLVGAISSRLDAVSGAALKLELDPDQDPVVHLLAEVWALLRDDERSALESLSGFSGSFSRTVAQQVARVEIGTLASLHRLGLIRTDQDRLMRLDSAVRSFALEKTVGSKHAIRRQISSAMPGLLIRSESDLITEANRDVQKSLRVYHHDFETAWEVAIDHRDWNTLARVVEPYVHYLLPVHAAAAYRLLLEARDVVLADPNVNTDGQRTLLAALTRGAALAAFVLREDDAAGKLWEDGSGTDMMPSVRDVLFRVRLLARAGRYRSALNHLDSEVFERGSWRLRFDSSDIDSARIWMERGCLLRHLGRNKTALVSFRAALDLVRVQRDRAMEARLYNELAITTGEADLGHALVLVDEGLRACTNDDDVNYRLRLLITKASMIRRVGSLDEASHLARHAYNKAAATSNYSVMAKALILEGQLDLQRGNAETAKACLSDGFRIAVGCCEPAEILDAVESVARTISNRWGSSFRGATELLRAVRNHPHHRGSRVAGDARSTCDAMDSSPVDDEVTAALVLVEECALSEVV